LVTALGLVAAGTAFLFLVVAVAVSGPEDGETTHVHVEAGLLGLAGVVVGSSAGMWGLATAWPRTALAGAGGLVVASVTVIVAIEAGPTEAGIELWRTLFVLAVGLTVAVALVGRRLRMPHRTLVDRP
jgi:hypothetical protein